MPQHGKILGSIVFSDSAFIFTKCNIKYIVKKVFYAPMSSHSFGKEFGVVFLARNIIAAFSSFFVFFVPLRHNNTYCPQPLPLYDHGQLGSISCVMGTDLVATMAFAFVLGEIKCIAIEDLYICLTENCFNGFKQCAFIALTISPSTLSLIMLSSKVLVNTSISARPSFFIFCIANAIESLTFILISF